MKAVIDLVRDRVRDWGRPITSIARGIEAAPTLRDKWIARSEEGAQIIKLKTREIRKHRHRDGGALNQSNQAR